jgi:hypothetical protein
MQASIYLGQANMLAYNIPSMVVSCSDSSSNNMGNLALLKQFNHLLNPNAISNGGSQNPGAGSVYSGYSKASVQNLSYAKSFSDNSSKSMKKNMSMPFNQVSGRNLIENMGAPDSELQKSYSDLYGKSISSNRGSRDLANVVPIRGPVGGVIG